MLDLISASLFCWLWMWLSGQHFLSPKLYFFWKQCALQQNSMDDLYLLTVWTWKYHSAMTAMIFALSSAQWTHPRATQRHTHRGIVNAPKTWPLKSPSTRSPSSTLTDCLIAMVLMNATARPRIIIQQTIQSLLTSIWACKYGLTYTIQSAIIMVKSYNTMYILWWSMMYFNYPVCCWRIPIWQPIHIKLTIYRFIGQLNHICLKMPYQQNK